MGVFDEKVDDIIIIRDDKHWEPGEQCRVRTVVKVADFEWVQNQLILIKQQSNHSQRRGAFQKEAGIDIQAQTGASDRLWVYRMLKDWTFTRGGLPVELTLKAVQQLPQSVLNFIYNEIMKRQPKDEEEETEEEGDANNDGGTPIIEGVSDSIDGNSSEDELVQGLVTSLQSMGKTTSRNHLSR